jgi:hypothetical protein
MTLKVTQEEAAKRYQADEWSGKLLHNVPVDLLAPYLASATDGFEDAVITPWNSDTDKNALYSEAVGKYRGMTNNINGAPDGTALREYHRFTKGRAALIADQSLRGKQNVMLVFFNEEKNDLHAIHVPAPALARMLSEQRKTLRNSIENDCENILEKDRVDDRPILATDACEATEKSFVIFKEMTGISVNAAAMEANGEDCVTVASSSQKETKHNSQLSAECRNLLWKAPFDQHTLN